MSTPMGSGTPGDVTSDDRLWAALAYVFAPIVPIIIMLMAGKKDRPFIRAHNMQALVLGVAMIIIVAIVAVAVPTFGSLLWLLMLWPGYQAYLGKMVYLPVVTDFVKKMGWA